MHFNFKYMIWYYSKCREYHTQEHIRIKRWATTMPFPNVIFMDAYDRRRKLFNTRRIENGNTLSRKTLPIHKRKLYISQVQITWKKAKGHGSNKHFVFDWQRHSKIQYQRKNAITKRENESDLHNHTVDNNSSEQKWWWRCHQACCWKSYHIQRFFFTLTCFCSGAVLESIGSPRQKKPSNMFVPTYKKQLRIISVSNRQFWKFEFELRLLRLKNNK